MYKGYRKIIDSRIIIDDAVEICMEFGGKGYYMYIILARNSDICD